MQLKTFTLLFCMCLLAACGKEEPLVTGPRQAPETPAEENDTLLLKQILVHGADSTIVSYRYDAAGRLAGTYFKAANAGTGKAYTTDETYERDNAGRIVKMTVTYGQPVEGMVYEPIEIKVVYQKKDTAHVAYTKTTVRANGRTRYDSAVYDYNTAGQVRRTTHYGHMSEDSTNTAPQGGSYSTWTYDATGNLAELQQFSANSTTPSATFRFEYDSKRNPHFTGDAALLERRWYGAVSPNNLTRQKNSIPGFPPEENTTTYAYDSTGRPLSGTFTGNGSQQQLFFIYNR